MELHEIVGRRGEEVDRHRENSARHAQAFAQFHSTGQGALEFHQRVDFRTTFIERPFVAYGSEVDVDELAELLDHDSDTNDMPPLPLACGYVTDWDTDERGFYLGAWCAVRVHFPPEAEVPTTVPVEMYHHFTFAGIAMKDVPLDTRS